MSPSDLWDRFRGRAPELAPPTLERRAYLVGDIHGDLAALDEMLGLIAADRQGAVADLVFLGDYIDRGPDSAGVLARLRTLEEGGEAHCLMGNHEVMCLEFLADPMGPAKHWPLTGGAETLESFGIGHLSAPDRTARLEAQAEALRAAMPPGLADWLAARPLVWQSGTLAAVHAYTDPARSLAEQEARTLLWARPPRKQHPRSDGIWVAHGHTKQPAPRIEAGHIALDTGAGQGGYLSAAVVDADGIRFLRAEP